MTDQSTTWLSYSQQKSMGSCGEQYRLERVLKVPSLPNFAMVGGSAFHAITEFHDKKMLGVPTTDRDGDALLDNFADAFEAELASREEDTGYSREEFKATGRASKEWPDKKNIAWWLHNGPVFAAGWARWIEAMPLEIWITPEGKPAIELEVVTVVGPNERTKGYIDRVLAEPGSNDPVYVVDLKTGDKESGSAQLGKYREDIRAKFGLVVPKGFFWYAKEGQAGTTYNLNAYSARRDQWLYQQVGRRKRAGVFLPVIDRHCDWCGVRPYCIWQDGEKSGEIRPPWVPIDEWESGDISE